jgi:hypothetical protein
MCVAALTDDRVRRMATYPFELRRERPRTGAASPCRPDGPHRRMRDRKPRGGFCQACGKPLLHQEVTGTGRVPHQHRSSWPSRSARGVGSQSDASQSTRTTRRQPARGCRPRIAVCRTKRRIIMTNQLLSPRLIPRRLHKSRHALYNWVISLARRMALGDPNRVKHCEHSRPATDLVADDFWDETTIATWF